MAKILLVEDDNNLREIYEARLAAEGYEIVSARDGEEALTVAMKEKPDLIISDVMMPKISGFDMLDILRTTEETKNAKVIMMTALSQAEDRERAEKLGADRYLVKSQVTLEDVAQVARDVLEGKPAEETPAAPITTETEESSDGEPVVALPAEGTETTSESEDEVDSEPSTVPPTPAPQADPVTPAPTPTPPAPAPEPVAALAPAQSTVPVVGLDVVSSAGQATGATPAPQADPVTPAPTPTPPAPAPEPVAAPEPTQSTASTTQVSDDPVAQSAQTEEQVIAQQIKDSLNLTSPAMDTTTQTQEPPQTQTSVTETVPSPSSAKRTIEPINDLNAPGPDLNAMAAKEEAAAQANQAVPQPATNEVITPNQDMPVPPPEPQTPPAPGTSVDPNSIAL